MKKENDTMTICGIELTGIKGLSRALKRMPNEHYFEVLVPRKGGELKVLEHVESSSYTLYDFDEYVRTAFSRPTSPEGIAKSIREAFKADEYLYSR